VKGTKIREMRGAKQFILITALTTTLLGAFVALSFYTDIEWLSYFFQAPTSRQIHFDPDIIFSRRSLSPYQARVVRSDAELRKLTDDMNENLKSLLFHPDRERLWSEQIKDFEKKTQAAKIDFARECLVLVPHSDCMGTIIRTRLHLRSQTLVVNLRRGPLGDDCGVSSRCFVWVVRSDEFSEVEVRVDGEHRETVKKSTP
jgi:hypothetical protein